MSLTKVSYSMISGAVINALDYGAVGDGVTDNQTAITNAVAAANATGASLYFPTGSYKVSVGKFQVTGGVKIFGDGPSSAIFSTAAAATNAPIFYVTGERIWFDSLQIYFQTFKTDTWSACIYIKNSCYESIFSRLLLRRGSYGIYCKYNTFNTGDTSSNYVYSTTFRDIRVSEYSQSAVLLSTAGGQGNSGNLLQNIYTINANEDVGGGAKRSAGYAFVFENTSDSVANQLNMEDCDFLGGAIRFGTCRNFTLNGLHVEGSVFTNDSGGAIDLGSSGVNLSGFSFEFNTVNVASAFALVRLDQSSIVVSQSSERTTTVTSAPLFPVFLGVNAPTSTAYGINFSAVNTNLVYSGISQTPPVVQQWNTDIYPNRIYPGTGVALWTSGSGTPEGAVTAPVGSLYTRTNGGAGTTLYIKESGTGNTGWVAK